MSAPPMPMASTCPSSSATRERAAATSLPTPRRTILTRCPSSSTSTSASRRGEPKETLTTVLSGLPGTAGQVTAVRRGAGRGTSGQVLRVPVEVRLGVDREAEAQPLPEPAGARVVAEDAGEHAPRAAGETPLGVARARAADAAALHRGQHEQQVHGGVARLGVVELVV